MTLRNRLYRAPVLEGAATRSSWSDVYIRAFEPNARAGVAMVVQGNSVVLDGGQTAPGMICVEDPEVYKDLARMTEHIHQFDTRVMIQLGHGGIYALQSWSKKRQRQGCGLALSPSPLPLWLRAIHPGVHVLSTEEVYDLIDVFGRAALRAREAGYDAVQLASSNAKLLHQFLTPVYNRRTDEFGGSAEARLKILIEIRKSIARHAGSDFPVTAKIPFLDHRRGISIETGLHMCRELEASGMSAITPVIASHLPSTALCRGDYPAEAYARDRIRNDYRSHTESRWVYEVIRIANRRTSKQYPFSAVWNRRVFSAARSAVSIPVFAVGGIRSRAEIDDILSSGDADAIGIGRPFYAEPDLPARLLKGDDRPAACASCNLCVPPQMLGYKGSCHNPNVQQRRRELESAQ